MDLTVKRMADFQYRHVRRWHLNATFAALQQGFTAMVLTPTLQDPYFGILLFCSYSNYFIVTGEDIARNFRLLTLCYCVR